MMTDHRQLTPSNGWQFVQNCQHQTPYPYPSRGFRTHHGCLYQHERGHYLYQWGFNTRGRASVETTFTDTAAMIKFFEEHAR